MANGEFMSISAATTATFRWDKEDVRIIEGYIDEWSQKAKESNILVNPLVYHQ